MRINSVNGPLDPAALGRTLMHEHLVIGFPGWESDTRAPALDLGTMIAACADRIQELKEAGFSTLLDPCPNDLGRNVELMAEVAARTSFNIIFATGLYNRHAGGAPYWDNVLQFDPDAERRLSDLFVGELTEGVRGTGLKPGVIKVATGPGPFSAYEKTIFRAAARASVITGAPITTHTDAVLGDEQVRLLKDLGVPAHRIIIGHSCCSGDHDYHMRILNDGAYIGFDRFGYEIFRSDKDRIASLLQPRGKGRLDQVIISHDSVCCWQGNMLPKSLIEELNVINSPLRFTRVIAPMLKEAGVTDAELDGMLIDNPRRYFSGLAHPAALDARQIDRSETISRP